MPSVIARLATSITNIQTIVAAGVSLVVAAFTAGVIYTSLMNRVSKLEIDLSSAH
jgi:hypothetical protein